MNENDSKADDVALIVCGTILLILFWGDPDLYDLLLKWLDAAVTKAS